MYPAYAYYGPESGRRQQLVKQLESELRTVHGDGLEIRRVYIGDDDLSRTLSELDTGSLFSSHTLALVQNSDSLGAKQDIDAVKAFLSPVRPEVTLVFIAESTKVDKKLLALIDPQARETCWELFENQKEGWITQYLRKQNASIEADAMDLFLSLVENNTDEMQQELDKILLLYPDEGQRLISSDLIEKYIYHSKEETVYSLFRAYGERDFSSALDILEKLLGMKSSDETGIINRFLYQLRQLASLRAIRDERQPIAEDFSSLRIIGKRNVSQFRDWSEHLDSRTLRRHVASCIEFEMQLRQQKSSLHAHLIRLWLYSLFFTPADRLLPRPDHRPFEVDHRRFG